MKWFEYAIAIFACIVLASATPLAYSIVGDCVVEENARYKITQCPHTLRDFTNYPNVTVWNKDSSAHAIDIAFGFDTNKAKPSAAWLWNENAPHQVPTYGNVSRTYTCVSPNVFSYQLDPKLAWCNSTNGSVVFSHWFHFGWPANATMQWNEWGRNGTTTEYWPDWVAVGGEFSQADWNGKTWFYRENVNFAANETKTLKARVHVKPNSNGKYDLFGKLSSDSFQEAFDNNRFVWLDPWWDANWFYKKAITLTETDGLDRTQEPQVINLTGLRLATANCSQEIRIIANYSTETEIAFEILNSSGQAFASGSQYCLIKFLVNMTAAGAANATYTQANMTNYYVYYGNLAAANVSRPPLASWNTSRFYSGSPVPTDDGWVLVNTAYDSNYSVSVNENYVWAFNDTGATDFHLLHKFTTTNSNNRTTEFRARFISGVSFVGAGITNAVSSAVMQFNDSFIKVTGYDATAYNSKYMSLGTEFHVFRLTHDNNTKSYRLYVDGTLVTSGTNATQTDSPNDDVYLNSGYLSTAVNAEIDYATYYWGSSVAPLNVSLGAEQLLNFFYTASETHDAAVYETATNYQTLNITFNGSIFNNATAIIDWNGTNYTVTNKALGSNYANFTFNNTIPIVLTNNTNANFTWYFNVTYYNASNLAGGLTQASQNIWFATYIVNVTGTPATALIADTITITSYVTNLGSSTYLAIHYFNNTNTTSPYASGGAWISTATAPSVAAATAVNGSAYINVTFGGVTILRNATANFTVIVYPINITTCGGGLPVILNYSGFNEDTLANVLTTHQITVTAWNLARTVNNTYNFTFTPTYGAEICLGVNATVSIDTFHLYNSTAASYGQRAHFLYNFTVSNDTTQNISLYLQVIPPSKATKITALDAYGVPLTYTDLTAQRFYPGNNTYLSVAMIRTDNTGIGYTYLQPNDVFYYFTATRAGVVLGLFSSQQIVCDSSLTLCTLTLQLEQNGSSYLDTVGKIASSCSWNPATNVTSCTFIDTSGAYHLYTMIVTKTDLMRPTVVCNESTTAASGTLSCIVNATGDYAVTLTASGSPINVLAGLQFFNGVLSGLFTSVLGVGGFLLAFLIVLVIMFSAWTTPATGIVLGGFAIVFSAFMGIIILGITEIIALIVFTVLVAWKLRN